jgi:hypothetical protein
MLKSVLCSLALLKKLLARICELNGPPVQLFLSKLLASCLAKTAPARPPSGSPAAPTIAVSDAGAAGSLLQTGTYVYYVTACSIRGESYPSLPATQAVTAGDKVQIVITGAAQYYNVYRSDLNGSAAVAKFIGKVAVERVRSRRNVHRSR